MNTATSRKRKAEEDDQKDSTLRKKIKTSANRTYKRAKTPEGRTSPMKKRQKPSKEKGSRLRRHSEPRSASRRKAEKRVVTEKKKRKSKQGEALAKALEKKKEKEKEKSSKKTDKKEEDKKKRSKKSKKSKWKRTHKKKRSKLKKYKEKPVFVVDEHDGTMVCMLRAIETGHLPRTGIKLLHFDSHPDLGTIPDKFDGLDEAYNQKYSIRELYDATDIATFITPMCLMNHVDFVVWGCAYWCDQFNPGTWKLYVGKDKNDGCIKIAAPKNKKLACLEYWESGGSVCKVEDFEYFREWTLMVVRYSKNCKLPQKQLDKLCEVFESGPWVLDIDEDFFSCNNPYFDEFRDMFGEKMHKTISKVYNYAEDTVDLEETLMSMFRTKCYMKSWSRFEKSSTCKHLLDLMTCDRRRKVLKDLHAFLRKNWPNGGLEEDESDSEAEWDGWDVKDFFTLDDLHRTGQLACLPHHISTADEIKKLMNDVDDLLGEMSEPLLVCVATSRLDRYLPDSQAQAIHGFVENMLTTRYATENIIRLDKPNFSVDCGESVEKKDSRYVTDICEDPRCDE